MAYVVYQKGDKVLVLCEVWDAGFTHEFYVTLEKNSWYIDRSAVAIRETPQNNGWVAGEVSGYVVEDYGTSILVELPYEHVMGSSRVTISKHLVRPDD